MIVVFGASGHAKEIMHFLQKNVRDSNIVHLFVDSSAKDSINEISVLSENDIMKTLVEGNYDCIGYIGIGNALIREKIVNKFSNLIKFENLLTTQRWIASSTSFGLGNILFPGSQFTINLSIGNHNHFNLSCSISHDCIIGNFNTFSPGVRLAGNVTIGNFNFFGINASVIDGVKIADNIVIGAGAVVIKDITEPGTYVGVPAKRIR